MNCYLHKLKDDVFVIYDCEENFLMSTERALKILH